MHASLGGTRRHFANLESSEDAIFSVDLNSTITSWSRAAERLLGYPAGEAIGRSARMILAGTRQHEEDEAMARIRAGEAVTLSETVYRRKDGSLLPVFV